jgi:putative Holliday junction resolvase
MRWLALDIGARRVGVAVCDRDETVVTPLEAVAFAPPERFAEVVGGLVARWEVEAVVVGVPITRGGGSRGERRVAAVREALSARLDVPVEEWDERGTTQLARAWLAEAGVPESRWAGRIDSLAAKAVLEGLLASRAGGRAGTATRIDQETHE